MKVKTYKHESLQEGLEDIKRDLGDEALILSTRSVSVHRRFGLFKKAAWEITAAVEEKPVAVPAPALVAAVCDRRPSTGTEKPAVIDRRYSAAVATAAAPARD